MLRTVLIAVCLGVMVVSGCSQGDNSAIITPEEKAQIKTDPMPEKTKSGKPNLNNVKAD